MKALFDRVRRFLGRKAHGLHLWEHTLHLGYLGFVSVEAFGKFYGGIAGVLALIIVLETLAEED